MLLCKFLLATSTYNMKIKAGKGSYKQTISLISFYISSIVLKIFSFVGTFVFYASSIFIYGKCLINTYKA